MTIVTLEDNADHTVTLDTVTGIQTRTYKPGTVGANTQALIAHATTAITNNDAYLAIVSPTQAQAITQVGVLTRQVNGLIRFAMGSFADVTDA